MSGWRKEYGEDTCWRALTPATQQAARRRSVIVMKRTPEGVEQRCCTTPAPHSPRFCWNRARIALSRVFLSRHGFWWRPTLPSDMMARITSGCACLSIFVGFWEETWVEVADYLNGGNGGDIAVNRSKAFVAPDERSVTLLTLSLHPY